MSKIDIYSPEATKTIVRAYSDGFDLRSWVRACLTFYAILAVVVGVAWLVAK